VRERKGGKKRVREKLREGLKKEGGRKRERVAGWQYVVV